MLTKLFPKAFATQLAGPLGRLSTGMAANTTFNSFQVGRNFSSEKSNESQLSTEISTEALLELIKKFKKDAPEYYLVDVRDLEERRKGIIPTSIFFPLVEIESILKMDKYDFQSKYKYPKFKESDRLIFHCHSGRRSAMAQKIARELGFFNSQNYLGSWVEFSKKYPEYTEFDPKIL
ncbi:hypothetical protein DSO57_1025791 [Entomophthora muscae]|uniref:Uncharacterized protein n=1 Tax=Entomophthora muscae TaxID=34485 RepID=A0ACC2U0N1_9FUNG|nr:hypothetical protein DSO57_1025791 [Entomophthora muscae]